MKKIVLLACFLLLINLSAQKSSITDRASSAVSTTDVLIDNYKMWIVENFYDLALNQSYLKTVSSPSDKSRKSLSFPVILVEGQSINESETKNIKPPMLEDYQFTDGPKNVLYGERGFRNRVLDIVIKK